MGKYSNHDILLLTNSRVSKGLKSSVFLKSYFSKMGHRIFLLDINAQEAKRVGEQIANSQNSNLNFNVLCEKADEVVKENSVKDCTIIVEDASWLSVVIYLKKKYYFKAIYLYDIYKDTGTSNVLFDYSDFIITTNKDSYYKAKEKTNSVAYTDKINLPTCIKKATKSIYGLVSIVIVTYNNLNFTKECINSILDKTAYPNYEIIIVDNNSSDDTKEYLKSLGNTSSNIYVMLNNQNHGFAKANNIGIRQSKGNYIILLNNDTIVTRGWISGFLKHLDRNADLGMVGPVTNSIANEARINVSYSKMDDMDSFAEAYTSANFNKLYTHIGMLAMFCVAMKKSIIDEIGYLDESFGIGMFEDDDFSHRIKLKGYKIACAEDVFIHHHGGASFGKLNKSEYCKLFQRNMHIFEKKWNKKWVYPCSRN